MAGIFDEARKKLMGAFGQEGAETNIQEQSSKESELAGWVKSRVEDVRSSSNRIAHEGIWMSNVAYLLGFSGVVWDNTTRGFRPVARNKGVIRRERVYSNMILPAVQNRLARLCKVPPRYEVRPNSQTTKDKDAARLGQEVINFVWDDTTLNVKRLQLLMWVQQCGHAYLKTTFDPDLGEALYDPETGEFAGYEGKIRVDVVSPFEVFADPLAKTLEDAQWLVQAKVRKLDYFRTRYPEKGMMVKEEGPWLLSAQYEMRINSLSNLGPITSAGVNEQMKNAAIELAYYEARSRKHPNGRLVIVANGVVLEDKELPIGEIPFAKFDDIVIGGKFYSEATVTHAKPLQDQYNTNLQKTADWVNRLLAGKYIAAKGHGLIQEALNNQSGEVVEYNPVPGASEPHAMQIPMLPAYVFQDRDALKRDMFEIFGLSEVSRGSLPSASIPAAGMQLLLDQDETRIGIEIEQQEHSYALVGRHILKHAANFFVTPRKLKTRGKDIEYKVQEFVGDDLGGNFDVQVVRGSTLPNNRFVKRQEILNAYTQGLLGDPADPTVREKVLGQLEFGDMAETWADVSVDEAQINRSIADIEKGIVPEVHELDNHNMHIRIKNRFRKSSKFLLLDPIAQAILLEDIEQHLQWLQKLMNPGLPGDDTDLNISNDMMMESASEVPEEVASAEDESQSIVDAQNAALELEGQPVA